MAVGILILWRHFPLNDALIGFLGNIKTFLIIFLVFFVLVGLKYKFLKAWVVKPEWPFRSRPKIKYHNPPSESLTSDMTGMKRSGKSDFLGLRLVGTERLRFRFWKSGVLSISSSESSFRPRFLPVYVGSALEFSREYWASRSWYKLFSRWARWSL